MLLHKNMCRFGDFDEIALVVPVHSGSELLVQHDVVCSNSSIVGTSSLDVAAMCLGADGVISAVLSGESKAKGKWKVFCVLR